MSTGPVERFPALDGLAFVRHGFIGRIPAIEVNVDREEALSRLASPHAAISDELGLGHLPRVLAAQVHGCELAMISEPVGALMPGVDGLMTATPGVCLGIYVADCCAIYLVDPERRAIALLHSGRKGTDLQIATAAIGRMQRELGCEPSRMIAQLSPCIRPPHYEVDFATEIFRQCRAAGIEQVFDCGLCTASDPSRYYSYRRELGKTGRMLALLALDF